ncbi:class I SAM-dependent methyltransferase [bacterium]|nr:class I SAM-dependent methyltransferase [bacterium]
MATDKISPNAEYMYDSYRFGKFSYRDKRVKYYHLLTELIEKSNKSKCIYDIGCGAGFWFDIYLKYGFSKNAIHGLDLAPGNVEQLQNKGYDVRYGTVLDLDYDNDISDITICNGVIHHTNNSFQAFKELVRITKPGGDIYVSVYNVWHPFFYIVYKATYPIRYIYWNWTKKIVNVFFPFFYFLYKLLSYFAIGESLDKKTAKTIFMDQVITPKAELFSIKKMERYASECNVKILKTKYIMYYLMISFIIKKESSD